MEASGYVERIIERCQGKANGYSLEPGAAPGSMMLCFTRNEGPRGPIETVTVLTYGRGPPPGHSTSPFDGGDWVHQIAGDDPVLRMATLAAATFIHPDPFYMYVRARNHEMAEALKLAGFWICGIGPRGWRVWTSRPRAADNDDD